METKDRSVLDMSPTSSLFGSQLKISKVETKIYDEKEFTERRSREATSKTFFTRKSLAARHFINAEDIERERDTKVKKKY